MPKSLTTSRILGLAAIGCAAGLVLGAGCPFNAVPGGGSNQAQTSFNAPTLRFTLPAARADVPAGAVVGLQWTDTHPAGGVTVRLFWDYDGSANTGDEVAITVLSEGPGVNGGAYAWNTTGMAPAKYRIGATIDDHINAPVTAYLAYEVVIRSQSSVTQIPTLELVRPSNAQSYQTGESVIIQWIIGNATPEDRLYLYYDTDLVAGNLNEQLINVLGSDTAPVGSSDDSWTIPDALPSGTYYILGVLSDGQHPDVTSYAPGSITVGAYSPSSYVRDLSRLGTDFEGVNFDGYMPNGRLGEVLAGGADYNNDGYDDFVLVAPRSFSALTVQNNGEAFLVYARPGGIRWPNGAHYSVGNIPGSVLHGVKFLGPTYGLSSAGIQSVQFIQDVDGDERPEVVFGMPNVSYIKEDQQDFDPLDSDQIHSTSPPAPPGWPPGRYYNHWDGWQEYSTNPDGITQDWLNAYPVAAGYTLKRSGMIIYGSSQSFVDDHIIWMDEIGANLIWARPQPTLMYGMRLYPKPGNDDTEWGTGLAEANLLGRTFKLLLVGRPMDQGGNGSVRVLLHETMYNVFSLWTTRPTPDIPGFTVTPQTFSFPGADDNGVTADPDRIYRWPFAWDFFMEPIDFPSPTSFNIMNSDPIGSGGHLGNPTAVGDFDGDTCEDVAVSSPDASPTALAQAGSAYLVYGAPDWIGVDVANFAGGQVRGVELLGTQAGERLGAKMAGPGDVTGDRSPDWLLASPNRSWSGRTNCGAVVLVPGQKQLFGRFTVDQVLTDLGGAIIYGADSGEHFGTYLASAGDVDRDGRMDFLVSAPDHDEPGRPKCGAVYLIYGGPHLAGEFDIRDIGTSTLPGKVYIGPQANAAVGPIASAGDTDGDHHADFLIAYPGATVQNAVQAGRVWLIYGGPRDAP
jgi:hypothetical protein